jgi:hypothetical protein
MAKMMILILFAISSAAAQMQVVSAPGSNVGTGAGLGAGSPAGMPSGMLSCAQYMNTFKHPYR